MTFRDVSGNVLQYILSWIIAIVCILLFNFITGYNGLYGQDSYEYLRYSRAIHEFIKGGPAPGAISWPPLFPLSGALLSFIFPGIFALQLTSFICYGLTYYFLYRILPILFPGRSKETGLYLILFFALSPFILRYSSSVMSEPMALMFITGFLFFYLRYSEGLKPGDFLLLVTFGCCAVNTRYPSFVLLILPFIHALILFIRSLNVLYLLISVFIAFLIFLPGYFFHSFNMHSLNENAYLNGWSVVNFFSRKFVTIDGTTGYTLPNILFVCSNFVWPGFIFMGIIFLFFIKIPDKNKLYLLMLLGSVIIHAAFLAGLPLQNQRLLVPAFTSILLLYFPAYFKLSGSIQPVRRRYRFFIYLSVVFIQLALCYRAYVPFYHDNRTERYISEKISGYPDLTIYTFNIDQALKAYAIKNKIINLYFFKEQAFEVPALVLFNPGRFNDQWQGMNPMLNWERLKKNYNLKLVESFPDGWKLYEITG